MTEDELREMERMWADGTSLKVMARRMGYTMEHLGFVMRQDRARFPKRHKSFTQGERDQWADRVLSGEIGTFEAARMAGVAPQTICKWEEGEEMTATEKFKRAEALFNDRTKRELADMVVHREADLEDARAENEELWALNEHMGLKYMAAMGELGEESERLKAENAKLRELARLLLWGIDNDMPRYEELAWTQKVNALVRELGVEVDR